MRLILACVLFIFAIFPSDLLADRPRCPTCGRPLSRATVRQHMHAQVQANVNAQAAYQYQVQAANYAAVQAQYGLVQPTVQYQPMQVGTYQVQAAPPPAPAFPDFPAIPPPATTTRSTTVQKFEYRWVPVP